MNNIKPYIDALLKVWHENSPAGRAGIVLLAAIAAVAITGVGYWSVQPSYVVLVSEGESDTIDSVIDALDKEGIDYTLSGAGGNLMVDQRDFAKAKMLARSSGATMAMPATGGLGGAFQSPTERRNLARLQKQSQLAATIAKMTIIDHADVHLNVPENGPFERKKSKPSASVLLTIRNGGELTEQQAMSIASFVAFAIEDLDPKDVQITDKDGITYTVPGDEVKQINTQVEYVAQAERRLAQKAEEQLFHFLGHGNASVQVSLDYTFTNGSKKSTIYDPDGKVAQEEDIMSESTTNMNDQASGAAGVASNLQSRRNGGGGSNVESKTENIKTSYLIPVTEETTSNTTPVRNLMTVSVIVNSSADGLTAEDGTLQPGLDTKVTSIVKNAVGFRDSQDVISVELLPFPSIGLDDELTAAPFDWSSLIKIVEKASLAIAGLLAFVMAFMLLKKVKPISEPAEQASSPEVNRERFDNVNQLSQLVKENPEVFERIIRAWSGNEESESSEPEKRNAA